MSEEIKDNENVPSDEIINEDDENELPLSTPNGHESPVVTSFSDIIIEKQDEPSIVSEESHTNDLLQIISDKSNKEANSAILNTVKN